MTKASIIHAIESHGKYCKVRISADNKIDGMLVNENYRYNQHNNSGGRRFIGYANEYDTMRHYNID